MLKAYKYRIYPNKTQAEAFSKAFGHNRFVWNRMLALKKRYYSMFGKSLSKRQVQDHLVKLKKRDKFSWLKEVNSQSLLATLDNLDKAYKRFFKQQAQFPRFKSKKGNWHSFSNPQHTEVDFESGTVKLPKIGWVKATLHREFSGKIKTATVKFSPSGKYTVSVLVEYGKNLPDKSTIEPEFSLGLDVGIKDFVITSSNEVFENKRFLQKHLFNLRKHNRILSRKKKGSIARSKQRHQLAKQHEKVANVRRNYLHQISHNLVSKNQATTLFVEDLAIKNMVKNKKLSRHIADVAWGEFLSQLEYKASWLGKNVIKIGRFQPSSKTCSSCGHVKETLLLSERVFECECCGTVIDRDHNAAINIKQFGLKQVLE
ncbi:MAG: transposase [Thiotrichales bacterium]|nr:transposase [Thiotrichales bacterium]